VHARGHLRAFLRADAGGALSVALERGSPEPRRDHEQQPARERRRRQERSAGADVAAAREQDHDRAGDQGPANEALLPPNEKERSDCGGCSGGLDEPRQAEAVESDDGSEQEEREPDGDAPSARSNVVFVRHQQRRGDVERDPSPARQRQDREK
jgi:hypothetical protein